MNSTLLDDTYDLDLEIDALVAKVRKLSGRVTVKVTRWYRRRSNDANRYYWGVVVGAAAAEWGVAPEDAHQMLKGELLPGTAIMAGPRMIVKPRSTAELDSAQFTRYVEACRQLLAECGVNTPDPE